MHLTFNNVNDAFFNLVEAFANRALPVPIRNSPSRYGDVLVIDEPMTITYRYPDQRVLLNPVRDCNPFFHVYEALWMLAGRNDVAPLAYYVKRMAEFSDDGKTIHDAYGYRWRRAFGIDQLQLIAGELARNPTSRRCVLQMWNADQYNNADLNHAIDKSWKAVPCNTHAYFLMEPGFAAKYSLNMTVCNRSNDLVWGMLGANYVHMTMMQQWLVGAINQMAGSDDGSLFVELGVYNQFTNNLHAYTNNFKPDDWLAIDWPDPYETEVPEECRAVPCTTFLSSFKYADSIWLNNGLIGAFVEAHNLAEVFGATNPNPAEYMDRLVACTWPDWWLQNVAHPLLCAYHYHKQGNRQEAILCANQVQATDWHMAAVQWLERRYNWPQQ